MEPADIVKQHRSDLVRRLIARNPLLNFRPRRGARIDICSLFGGHTPSEAATQFLRDVIKSDEKRPVTVDLSSESTKGHLAPLRKLQDNALDAYRATGRWEFALAWPLLNIPRKGTSAYCAPLLFWKIGVAIQGQRAKFFLHEDGMEFNFMLKAWLEAEHGIEITWDDDDDEVVGLDILVDRIRDAFRESGWGEFQDFHSFEEDGYVNKYRENAGFIPCAVIGKAGFPYRSLLDELNKLRDYLQQESPKGLLCDLLIGPDGVDESFPANEPNPADRWLVTDDSDATQEASVWQARQEKIMLIKGPPGTGKSQTIVNLIADAVQRGERVVLVCQKKPALDVIRQRLGGAGHNLDSIVLQIDEPRRDRRAIIRKVRDIGENDPIENSIASFDERNMLCESIARSESECMLPDNNNFSYSVRGDLLAKLSRIKNETGFNPSITRSELFMSQIKEAVNEPVNQYQSDQWRNRMKELVGDWERCDYRKNPWHLIDEKWDTEKIPRLFGECEELREIFALIAAQRDSLPAHIFLNLAASPLMTKYFYVFFAGKRRETVRLLCRLISDTRQLFLKSAEMNEVAPLWNKLFNDNTDGNPYEYYGSHCDDISIIQTIHRRLREHDALRIITDEYPDQREKWEHILLAAVSKLRLDNMPFKRYDYERAVEHLKDGISSKKELDKDNILTGFSARKRDVRQLRKHDLLRLNAGGGKPATSLRRLYHKGNDFIWKIYPVLLANPDTLCQILPNKPGSIDTAIIDEASQMFTADALPIFHRAKKIIISGDNKQMPPADFFSAAAGDDADDEDEGDLDDRAPEQGVAAAQGRFELFEMAEHLLAARGVAACCDLEVHYRSRPAELIAFSNHAFYDGKLQTAPYNDSPPECMKRPIEMERIPGIFEEGVNQEEIQAVIEKLRVIWAVNPPPSVGVIVFNTKQASALKDKINETCENDADFRKRYDRANDADEDTEFFVRSVENVQGDERDIIILATTYGERRNYGPISRIEKGRRRLNVAITRAKKGMIVITSLGIGNISNPGERPDGNPGEGKERWYLWMYMRYACAVSNSNDEEAKAILREINPTYQPRPTGGEPDSEFEVDVANFLRKKYHVDYQIGESGFRIDLGVKREGDTRYLCGVECDGRSFHSGWRARHNDIWRQGVLEDKGWKIVRIWSDKWYNASEAERGKELLEEIRAIEQKLIQKADVE